tara:strand:+ start:180 stop:308 length:129 start_codon:yes stop_codon:yes gene_type:complete
MCASFHEERRGYGISSAVEIKPESTKKPDAWPGSFKIKDFRK